MGSYPDKELSLLLYSLILTKLFTQVMHVHVINKLWCTVLKENHFNYNNHIQKLYNTVHISTQNIIYDVAITHNDRQNSCQPPRLDDRSK